MSSEPENPNTYFLDKLIYRGPSISFPDDDDTSEVAFWVRLVFLICQNTLYQVQNGKKLSQKSAKKHWDRVQLANVKIEVSDMSYPDKEDLKTMLFEAARLRHTYIRDLA